MTGQNQCLFLTGLRKQPTFSDVTTGFPLKWHLRDKRTNSILIMHWCEVYMKSEQWCIISMEFLCTFLRCHITWKSKVASQNVGCFLRLIFDWTLSMTPSGAWSNTRFSFWLTRMHTWQTVKRICHFIRSQLMLYFIYPFTAMLKEYVVNIVVQGFYALCFFLDKISLQLGKLKLTALHSQNQILVKLLD